MITTVLGTGNNNHNHHNHHHQIADVMRERTFLHTKALLHVVKTTSLRNG
jgi:hypothetical protein